MIYRNERKDFCKVRKGKKLFFAALALALRALRQEIKRMNNSGYVSKFSFAPGTF
jgi:hypothetical protein